MCRVSRLGKDNVTYPYPSAIAPASHVHGIELSFFTHGPRGRSLSDPVYCRSPPFAVLGSLLRFNASDDRVVVQLAFGGYPFNPGVGLVFREVLGLVEVVRDVLGERDASNSMTRVGMMRVGFNPPFLMGYCLIGSWSREIAVETFFVDQAGYLIPRRDECR